MFTAKEETERKRQEEAAGRSGKKVSIKDSMIFFFFLSSFSPSQSVHFRERKKRIE
jgi:hypothetical protein